MAEQSRLAARWVRLARRNPATLAIPILAMAVTWATWAAIFAELGRLAWARPVAIRIALTTTLSAYPGALMTTFAAVAFVAVLHARLDGVTPRLRNGVAKAGRSLGTISGWAVLSAWHRVVSEAPAPLTRAARGVMRRSQARETGAEGFELGIAVIAVEGVPLAHLTRRCEQLARLERGRLNAANRWPYVFWLLVLAPVIALAGIAMALVEPGVLSRHPPVLVCTGSFLLVTTVTIHTAMHSLMEYRMRLGAAT